MSRKVRALQLKLNPSIKNTFIIASPRSGTTWISKALNVHPQVYCTERRLFGRYADLVKNDAKDELRLRCTLDHFAYWSLKPQAIGGNKAVFKAYLKALQQEEYLSKGKRNVIDKITPYVHTSHVVSDGIKEHFPKSKLIFLLRDGRDVCTSGVFHWFNKQLASEELSDFEKSRRETFVNKAPFKGDRFFTTSEIEEWAHTWSQPLREIDKFDSSKVLLISYEDMLQDQRQVLSQVYSHAGVSNSNAILDKCVEASTFKKMSGNREQGEAQANAHVRKGVSGDWKNYFVRQDAELFNEIAGDMLLKYGYVTDSNWVLKVPEKLS
jgi:hypothetical protein